MKDFLKGLFYVPVLMTTLIAKGQPVFSRDSAIIYLTKLSNKSVVYQQNNAAGAVINTDAAVLYNNANEFVIDELIQLLADSSKILACHYLLSRLLEPGSQRFYHTTEDLTDSILVINRFNGLTWVQVYDKINLTQFIRIDSLELQKITAYWQQRRKRLPMPGK